MPAPPAPVQLADRDTVAGAGDHPPPASDAADTDFELKLSKLATKAITMATTTTPPAAKAQGTPRTGSRAAAQQV
jgi:hypothetical protein